MGFFTFQIFANPQLSINQTRCQAVIEKFQLVEAAIEITETLFSCPELDSFLS